MAKEFAIGNRKVGKNLPAFIVAEISANHQQDFETAVTLIQAAKKAGADAVKMQTFTPDTMTIESDKEWFRVGGEENPASWKGMTFYELYQKAYTPWEWQPKLKVIAEELGLVFFSTPFDATAVDFLETLDVPCYKISSYEATDIPLLKKVASTGKPIILSVGFATLDEIRLSVDILRKYGTEDLALLHCLTSYHSTAIPEHTHLRTMMDLCERFDVVCGLSDNMGGIEVPALAAAMGAAIIEKHLVLHHEKSILDDRFSLDQRSFNVMTETIRWQEKAMGSVHYGPLTPQEVYNRNFRRSLFVVERVEKGEPFTQENVREIRPAYGMETKYFDEILGKRAAHDIEPGTPLTWDLIEEET